MKKLILLFTLTLFFSCESEDQEVKENPIGIQVPSTPPSIPNSSSSMVRTGKILEVYIGNYPTNYLIKTDKSINPILVTKEWYDKAKVGYTIRYIEYPVEVFSITAEQGKGFFTVQRSSDATH